MRVRFPISDLTEPQLPRKPNYGFEKRKKELDRQAKKNEKLRKREEARERSEEPPATPAEDASTPPSE